MLDRKSVGLVEDLLQKIRNKTLSPCSFISGGGGVTSIHSKRGFAILTLKVVPKNPGTYLKLRPKNPGTRNTRLFFLVRKLTTQIRKSNDSTISLCFTMFVPRVLNFLQLLSVQVTTYKMLSKINIILPL